MALLRDADREGLRKELAKLSAPVKLVFFSQALDCEYCPVTKQILEEIVSLTDKVQVQEYDFSIEHEAVARYKIARVPAIAIVRVEQPKLLVTGNEQPREIDYGIRYYGVPAGTRNPKKRLLSRGRRVIQAGAPPTAMRGSPGYRECPKRRTFRWQRPRVAAKDRRGRVWGVADERPWPREARGVVSASDRSAGSTARRVFSISLPRPP